MANHANPNHSLKRISKLTSKDAPRKITSTPEQSQISVQVYQLILGWQRARLVNNKQTSLMYDPINDSKNIQPSTMEVEV